MRMAVKQMTLRMGAVIKTQIRVRTAVKQMMLRMGSVIETQKRMRTAIKETRMRMRTETRMKRKGARKLEKKMMPAQSQKETTAWEWMQQITEAINCKQFYFMDCHLLQIYSFHESLLGLSGRAVELLSGRS